MRPRLTRDEEAEDLRGLEGVQCKTEEVLIGWGSIGDEEVEVPR